MACLGTHIVNERVMQYLRYDAEKSCFNCDKDIGLRKRGYQKDTEWTLKTLTKETFNPNNNSGGLKA